ncbi:hypothetical protein KIW84_022444 [Lathyrus oleraceus]|uniref:Putative plant transposon protein domain-containing protein n=1 Tax=Pisum sativum TaxID=3888 RepID=A0A9D5B5B2_PEA|nr:hypothetical protein KIW84_022444 [Pisum sativum]
MASQLSYKGKGKGKVSSSRGSLDLSRLLLQNINKKDFYPELVKVFYSNMVRKKGKLTFIVKGVPIPLTASDICAIFEIPPGGHKFVGTISTWENYTKHAFYYSLSRLSEHQIYNKRNKSYGGDNPERVYWSPAKFSINDRMLHYFLVYVVVPRFSNHCTITDPEMMLLYSIKTHFHVDWGHSILSHMMSHDEHVEGLPYAHLLTNIFRHFNVNLENELCFSMEKPSFMIRIKQINRKMGVIFNPRTLKIKYLDNEDEEPQQEANNDDDLNPPKEVQSDQPSNQMIMDYLQGFCTDVMTEIGHLSSRMDRWELSQVGFQCSSFQGGGFQGGGYPSGGSNDGNNNQ